VIGNSLKTEKSTGTSGICFRGRYTFKWRSEVDTMFRKQSQTQSNPVSDSMGIDRASATSKRIPCRVPVFKGLWRGTVIVWAGGPSWRSLTWLPFWRITVYPRPVST